MSRRQKPQQLNRIRQREDWLEEADELDDLAQEERIRRQERDDPPVSDIKQHRRQREKEWGRTLTRIQRNHKREGRTFNKP